MLYTPARIHKALGYKLIGTKFLKEMVCQTLLIFPNETFDFITQHCWFVGSFEDGNAFTLRAGELKKGEYLIFLSDALFEQDEEQIRYTIAHEIGHVVLGHRNSIGKPQTRSEIRMQEREADAFARCFLQ